jgi:hypothetical protein
VKLHTLLHFQFLFNRLCVKMQTLDEVIRKLSLIQSPHGLLCNHKKSKIHGFGRVVIENPLNIFIFAGLSFAIIPPGPDICQGTQANGHGALSDWPCATKQLRKSALGQTGSY